MNWSRIKWIGGHAVGALVVLVAVVYVARPSPHVPPYDANLVRLAETERQGYCAGVVFWKTQGEGDAGLARGCRRAHPEESGAVNLVATERGFCRGIVDQGYEDTVSACIGILGSYRYWPTYDGSITDQWNRARPYPKPAITGPDAPDDESRTGGRTDVPTRGNGYYP